MFETFSNLREGRYMGEVGDALAHKLHELLIIAGVGDLQCDLLMLCQFERFERPQHSCLVDCFKLSGHS